MPLSNRKTSCVSNLVAFAIIVILLHPGRFSVNQCRNVFKVESMLDELRHNAKPAIRPHDLNLCPLTSNRTVERPTKGHWSPKDCLPRFRIVLILPYRDRRSHLQSFLEYIHKFLQGQNVSYVILVVEQSSKKPFNRAKLFNIGFIEASGLKRLSRFDCFIFHDVDLLPLDFENIYACSKFGPRHLSARVDKFRYNLPYEELFGGAVAMERSTMERVNGFSNEFYGTSGFPVCKHFQEMFRFRMGRGGRRYEFQTE